MTARTPVATGYGARQRPTNRYPLPWHAWRCLGRTVTSAVQIRAYAARRPSRRRGGHPHGVRGGGARAGRVGRRDRRAARAERPSCADQPGRRPGLARWSATSGSATRGSTRGERSSTTPARARCPCFDLPPVTRRRDRAARGCRWPPASRRGSRRVLAGSPFYDARAADRPRLRHGMRGAERPTHRGRGLPGRALSGRRGGVGVDRPGSSIPTCGRRSDAAGLRDPGHGRTLEDERPETC